MRRRCAAAPRHRDADLRTATAALSPLRRDRTAVALGAIVLAGAVLRFATLGVQSFEADEGVTIHLLRMPLGDMLSAIPDSESTPPLYYLLAWLWTHVFGLGEAGVRSFSALAGSAAVPVAFLAARELVSVRAGLIAAALMAFDPLMVWHAQQARAYALLVLLAALGLWLFARALRDPSRRLLAWWAVVSIAALATHWFAGFLVAGELVWLLAARRAAARRIGAAGAAVVVAVAALAPLAIHQDGNGSFRPLLDRSGSLGSRLVAVPKQFLVGFDAPMEVAATIVAAALAGAGVIALARHARAAGGGAGAGRGGLLAAGLGLASVAVPVLLAIAGADYLLTRNVIASWPALFVAVAAGFAVTGRAGVAAAGVLCALLAAITIAVAADPRLQRDDWRGAATALGPAATARAIILSGPGVDGRDPAPPDVLSVYARGIAPVPDAGIRVRELDYVDLATHAAGQARRAVTPRLPGSLPPGLRLIGRRVEPTYSVVRYGFAAAGLLTPRRVVSLAGAPAVLLVQRP